MVRDEAVTGRRPPCLTMSAPLPQVTWQQVTALARDVDEAAACNAATSEQAAQLARLILDFNNGLMGPVVTKAPSTPPSETG
jgi:hypothetical protein